MNDETRPNLMSYMQTVSTIAVVLFALLLVTVDRPLRVGGRDVLPVALGIAGLLFVAAGLMAMESFRAQWRSRNDADGGSQVQPIEMAPLAFEVGLWALGLLYVVRLVEIARG
jgi:hypothetical protein